MRVEVYRNLHTGKMSVRECSGRVLAHEDTVLVLNPVFVVQPAGRAKVLQEQRKNVHAFVRGELVGFSTKATCMTAFIDEEGHELGQWNAATYNPYKAPWFFNKDTEGPVQQANAAIVSTAGVWYR